MAGKKFNWSKKEGYPTPITNENLVCNDCEYNTVVASKCEVYPRCKPDKILLGGPCGQYKKDDRKRRFNLK